MSPERDAAAYREATRDPIFLFQHRRWQLTEMPDGWSYDDDGHLSSDDDPDAPQPSVDDLLSWECAVAWWETERVYLTREEGERYGQARHYNYPNGWRVYCVCAEGALAALLREHA